MMWRSQVNEWLALRSFFPPAPSSLPSMCFSLTAGVLQVSILSCDPFP